jgi:peptidoglycan/LPS O-acetylase OafA/YrhL
MEAFLAPESEARHLAKNKEINGFRALLCALVVAYHYGGIYFVRFGAISKLPSLYPNLIIMVVGMFFLVSGFFLSFKSPWDFLKSKLIRIYLPFAFAISFVFLICYYAGYPKYIFFSEWGLNFLVYPLAMGQANYAAGNLWFIVYLWVFFSLYFLINLIAYPFRQKINLVPILMGICGVFAFAYRYIVWNETTVSFAHRFLDMLFLGHYHSYSFLYLGYALRILYESISQKAKWPYILGAAIFSAAFLSFLMVNLYGDDHYHYGSAILFYGLLILFVLALYHKLHFFAWGGFQLLGNASLWIYMIHENVGYLIINSFYSIDSSLYPAGLYLAIVYAYLVGLLLYVSEQFLHQRVSALKIKTAKAPNSLP